MKYILIITFFAALLVSKTSGNNNITVLSAEEFKAQTENINVQLVDVRTPREFKLGHITGAINIDFYARNFSSEFHKLNKEQAVYIYCRSGSRSSKASKKLEAMGFTEIYDLKGGFLKYK